MNIKESIKRRIETLRKELENLQEYGVIDETINAVRESKEEEINFLEHILTNI